MDTRPIQKSIKNKKPISSIIVIILVCVLSLALPKVTHAQSVSLSITPPIFEAVIKPNEEITQTYTLTNNGNESIFTSQVVPFSALDEYGNVSLGKGLSDYDPYNTKYWFSFVQSQVDLSQKFHLAKGESRNFNLKIKIPDDASLGDYYFTLLFITQPEGIGVNTGTVAQVKVGSNILLTISKDGQVYRQAKVEEFSAPKIIDSFSAILYKVRIANEGTSFFKPQGQIEISSWFGKKTLTLAPLNVIVGSTRELTCIKNEQILPCGIAKSFLIGPYKARLNFKIEGVAKEYQKTITQVAIPLYPIFALGLCFFIFSVSLKLKRGPINKNKARSDKL